MNVWERIYGWLSEGGRWGRVYPGEFADGHTLWRALADYFRFYNHGRPHQALGYRTPASLYHTG